MRSGAAWLLSVSVGLSAGPMCARAEAAPAVREVLGGPAAVARAAPAPAPEGDASAPLPPLDGPPLERLDLGGGEIVHVALPVGARDRRAVVVGVHGAGDRPDWSCVEWKAVTADWPFVVCPRGTAHPQYPGTFVWGSGAQIASLADRAVAAVRARYGAWVDDGPLVYGGWSQGGTLAADVVAARPRLYDRVALVEVGHTPLDPTRVAAAFAQAGVKRAVVSCSSVPCRRFARGFDDAARRRALPVRLSDVGLRGHWFDEPVFRELGPKVGWLVDDGPRFVGMGAAIDARWLTD